MKARLIQDAQENTVILCEDGTIAKATNENCYLFLTSFSKDKVFSDGTEGRWDLETPDMASYCGTTLAYISDNKQLVISDFKPFLRFTPMDRYISSTEYAKMHGVSYELIKLFCREGRIPGAMKVARNWLIPQNAPYPVDPVRHSKRRRSAKQQ